MKAARACLAIAGLLLGLIPSAFAGPPDAGETESDVHIGVLAYRGAHNADRRWSATADYLTEQVPGHRFIIRPLTLSGMRRAVQSDEIDFILTNPGNYVQLEAEFGLTRLATLKNRRQGKPYTVFGAVIFTRADRTDIQTLRDLKDKSFMAVSRQAFGGFQIAWRELLGQGIDPFKDFNSLEFNGFPQDAIVYAVRDGLVDAGTVRTDILERMAKENKIDIDNFRVLHSRVSPTFPFRHSTRLYPEWPFAKAPHTNDALAQGVSVALLTMPERHTAAVKGRYTGWTVPLDYKSVKDLFKELQIGPYRNWGTVDLKAFVRAYLPWIFLAGFAVLSLSLITTYVLRLNRRLRIESRRREHATSALRRNQSTLRRLHRITSSHVDSFEQKLRELLAAGCERFKVSLGVLVRKTAEGLTVVESVNIGTSAGDDTAIAVAKRCVDSPRTNHSTATPDADPYSEPSIFDSDEQGAFGVPVMVNNLTWGYLIFANPEGSSSAVDGSQTEILKLMAQWVGSEIHRQEIEQRSRQHEATLQHVARVSSMDEMASAIAHELNQPLAAIVNYSRGCIRRLETPQCQPEQIREVLEQIAEQGERSGNILRRLRSFLKRHDSSKDRHEINELVKEAAELARADARQKQISISLELEQGLPPVLADAIQIQQVIMNLVRNAIDAIAVSDAPTRQIAIHTSMNPPASIKVTVSDSGPGIPETDANKIFEPFVTTKPNGMGIGLAISRSIIEAHKGRLSAQNLPNSGAAVSFTLPVSDKRGS